MEGDDGADDDGDGGGEDDDDDEKASDSAGGCVRGRWQRGRNWNRDGPGCVVWGSGEEVSGG